MTFIETLNRLISDNDACRYEQSIEIYIRQKLPTIFNFIFKDIEIETDCSFSLRKNSKGCLIHLQNNFFEIIGQYEKNSPEFSFDIHLNLQRRVIPTVGCYFNEYLELLRYEFRSNFGQFGFEQNLYMHSVRFSDESRTRKFHLEHIKNRSITILENLEPTVHKVDRNFDKVLSSLLLFNFRKSDVYSDAFNYLPTINLDDSVMTTNFINELSSRYYNKDALFEDSLHLMAMYDF